MAMPCLSGCAALPCASRQRSLGHGAHQPYEVRPKEKTLEEVGSYIPGEFVLSKNWALWFLSHTAKYGRSSPIQCKNLLCGKKIKRTSLKVASFSCPSPTDICILSLLRSLVWLMHHKSEHRCHGNEGTRGMEPCVPVWQAGSVPALGGRRSSSKWRRKNTFWWTTNNSSLSTLAFHWLLPRSVVWLRHKRKQS